jgi:hypothetical protein
VLQRSAEDRVSYGVRAGFSSCSQNAVSIGVGLESYALSAYLGVLIGQISDLYNAVTIGKDVMRPTVYLGIMV